MGNKAPKKQVITEKEEVKDERRGSDGGRKRRQSEDKLEPTSSKTETTARQVSVESSSSAVTSSKASESESDDCETPPMESRKVRSRENTAHYDANDPKSTESSEANAEKPKKRRKKSEVEDEAEPHSPTEATPIRMHHQGGFMMPKGLISELKENQGMPKLRPTKVNTKKDTNEKEEPHFQIPALKPLKPLKPKPIPKVDNEKQQQSKVEAGIAVATGSRIVQQRPETTPVNQGFQPSRIKVNDSSTVAKQTSKKKPIPQQRTKLGNSTENLLVEQGNQNVCSSPPQPAPRVLPSPDGTSTVTFENKSEESESLERSSKTSLGSDKHNKEVYKEVLHEANQKVEKTQVDSSIQSRMSGDAITFSIAKMDHDQTKESGEEKLHAEKRVSDVSSGNDNDSKEFSKEITPPVYQETRESDADEKCYGEKRVSTGSNKLKTEVKKLQQTEDDTKSETASPDPVNNEIASERATSALDRSHEAQIPQSLEDKESEKPIVCQNDKTIQNTIQDELHPEAGASANRFTLGISAFTKEFESVISEISNIKLSSGSDDKETTGHVNKANILPKTDENQGERYNEKDELETLQALIDMELQDFTDMLNVIDKPLDPLVKANTYDEGIEDK